MAALGLGIGLPAAITRDPAELRFLRLLFVVALLVRCALAAVLYIKLPYGYFAPDETGTILAASDYLANRPTRSLGAHGQAWAYLNILIFDIFGTEPMLPRLWNCLVGAMTPVIGYALARDFGAIRGARWSAVLIGFFPSLVLWSSLNLHDVDAYLVILIALLLTTRLQQDPRWWRVVALALALLATYLLRIFADAALFIAVVAGLLAWRLRLPQRLAIRIVGVAGAAGVAVVVGALVFPRAGEFIYARSGLSLLAGLRRSLASGARSAVDVDPGLQSLGGVLAFLPVGLVDFFLRPFPWEGGSGLNLLTRPEVIFYYLLLPLVGIGMALAVRKAASRALPRLVFLGVTGLGYSLTLSNLGTIYRERDELLIVMFTFVGVAIDAIVSRLRTWRRRRT
jgi:4-amino-4-deoxy-L-arabinose transferase-like glycosyltransferase